MSRFYTVLMSTVFLCVVPFIGAAKSVDLSDLGSSQGYSIGFQLGMDFKAKEIVVNSESLLAGINDGMAGNEPLLTQQQMSQIITELQKRVEERRRALFLKSAEENKLKGEKFLTENSTKEGVITLPSGLQYKVVTEGKGKKPSATDTVTVNYRGTLPDGTEFDSSFARGKAASFPVNRVIPGWTEALQLMPIGSKWLLYVPPALAYGEKGSAPKIGPNQLLVFEVELLSVE